MYRIELARTAALSHRPDPGTFFDTFHALNVLQPTLLSFFFGVGGIVSNRTAAPTASSHPRIDP